MSRMMEATICLWSVSIPARRSLAWESALATAAIVPAVTLMLAVPGRHARRPGMVCLAPRAVAHAVINT